MNRLLLATHNADKVEEIRALFAGVSITLLTPADFPGLAETVEDADTLEGNALKKAREAFAATGVPAVADDTGLEVHYLGKAPGVFSSRYSGTGATYASNRKKLLDNLRGVPPRKRAARFRTVVAFVPAQGDEYTVEGICRGTIIESPRGANGFGYDPVFLPDGFAKTFGEMDLALKNTLSHRARAFVAFKELLRSRGWMKDI
jgi:XTP/dITP diphosphohydrolase